MHICILYYNQVIQEISGNVNDTFHYSYNYNNNYSYYRISRGLSDIRISQEVITHANIGIHV